MTGVAHATAHHVLHCSRWPSVARAPVRHLLDICFGMCSACARHRLGMLVAHLCSSMLSSHTCAHHVE
eukprot:1863902-Alexandrium_andersonii.AAC.1